MSLASGTPLGPYVIEASLGAGGMGEVYRARDTRLDRTVAVKVLTGALAADAESRQRFEHEARAIAALNDSHICTIHDVGRHGDLDYLVFEYLEGETLADRLRRAPDLTVADALGIAIQIADALHHAHRAGIVHRDLKPGNVMLVRRPATSDAPDVKLLDFGLASRVSPSRPAASQSLTETMGVSMVATRPATAPVASGFSGTVPYMAPEQLNGDPGDHRADIFAFGCVLYEMLAGRKAFDGTTAITVVAAITSTEPPQVPAIQAHPLLDHVLRRCLDKDRERRWQNIGDVAGELRWLAEHPAPTSTAMPQSRAARTPWVIAIAAIAVAAAALLLALRPTPRAITADAPTLRFEVSTPPTDDPSVSLSPDGTVLAFVANRDHVPMLWLRPLGALESRELPGTQGASFPFWSPDGRALAFFADDKLKRVDVAAGAPLVVVDAPNARGGTWSGDGVILFVAGPSAPISRVAARGGPVEQVTQLNAGAGAAHRLPQFLPDGKHFVFTSALGTAETNGIYVGSLDKSPAVRVLAGDIGGRFAAPDRLLTITQGALQSYKFDPASGKVQGEPVIVAQGFAAGSSTSGIAASATGVIAYRAGSVQRRQLVWVRRDGTVLHEIGEPRSDYLSSPELSADEHSVAVFLQRTGDNDIWVIDLSRNLAQRVTVGPPTSGHPLWDPDGQHVVFTSRRFGGPARQALSNGAPEPLLAKGETGQPLSWTRDRHFILLRRANEKTGFDVIAVSTSGQPREVVVAQSPADETEAQFSPDGKWVAFVSNEGARPDVFLQSFPDGRARIPVSPAGGTQVRWSADGKEIFYVAPDGKMMAVSVTLGAAKADVKLPLALFQTHLATGTNVLGIKPQYAVARDGRFLLNNAIESASAPIVVSANWMKGLSK